MKKILLTLLVLTTTTYITKAQVKVGPDGDIIATGDYPAAKPFSVKGANIEVQTIIERNNIPDYLRQQGTLVFVKDSSRYYYLSGGITNTNWKTLELDAFSKLKNNAAKDSILRTDENGMVELVKLQPDSVVVRYTNNEDSTLIYGFNSKNELILQIGAMLTNMNDSTGGGGGNTDLSNYYNKAQVDSNISANLIDPVNLTAGEKILITGVYPNLTISAFKDTTYQWAVLDSLNTPPSALGINSKYLVGTSPSGDFAGQQNKIAVYDGINWTFQQAVTGDLLYNATTTYVSRYTGSSWVRQGFATGVNWWSSRDNNTNIRGNFMQVQPASTPFGGVVSTNVFFGGNNFRRGSYPARSVAVGATSQHNSVGTDNTSMGDYSLWYSPGSYNSAFGSQALGGNQLGKYNIGWGYKAGERLGSNGELIQNGSPIPAFGNGYLVISPYTTKIWMNLDSVGGEAPSVVGIDNTGNWRKYKVPSGSGGGTNTLQQTTDAGSTTTNNITVAGMNMGIESGRKMNQITTGNQNNLMFRVNGDVSGYIYNLNYTNEVIGNIGFGYFVFDALKNQVNVSSMIGSYGNSAIGLYSMRYFTKGAGNSALGASTLANITEGSGNTAIGRDALRWLGTGMNNTAIGSFAGAGSILSLASLSNTTALGSFAIPTKSNQIVIGDENVTELLTHATILSKVAKKESDPTTTEIPDGFTAVYTNTTTNKTYLWVNNNGTLLKVELQ